MTSTTDAPAGYWTCRHCTEVIPDTGDGFALHGCPTCAAMTWAWLPQPEIHATLTSPVLIQATRLVGRLVWRQTRVGR